MVCKECRQEKEPARIYGGKPVVIPGEKVVVSTGKGTAPQICQQCWEGRIEKARAS